jgi:hypothetical protein
VAGNALPVRHDKRTVMAYFLLIIIGVHQTTGQLQERLHQKVKDREKNARE